MTSKTILIIVLVLIVLAGIIWYVSGSSSPVPGNTQTQTQPVTTLGSSTQTSATMVTYTDSGFSPSTVTIADGQTVMWMNNSSENLWVASDPHPIHNGYDGTTLQQHCAPGYAGPAPFDECTSVPPGSSWSFTFYRVGTWGYHNHMDPEMRGTVIVTSTSTSTNSASDSM